MYDDLYNFIDNLSYLDTVEDEDYQEDIIEIEQERLKQLKLDRLKLIKKAAKKIQKPSQKQPEAIVATPTITPKVAPVDVRKLTVKLTGASTDDLISTFIFSSLYLISQIKPEKKRTILTLKKESKNVNLDELYKAAITRESNEVMREWGQEEFTRRITIKGRNYELPFWGYGSIKNKNRGKPSILTKMHSIEKQHGFDDTLLYLLKEEFDKSGNLGMFYKKKLPRGEAKYLLSPRAVEWFEKQLNNGE